MNQKKLIAAGAALVIAFLAGRYFGPQEVQIKEVEKVVYKESLKQDRNQNVREVEKETRLPDGTVIKERIKTKETETLTDYRTEIEKRKEKSQVITSRPDWRLGLVYEPAIPNHQEDAYTGLIERRIFSEIYLGVSIGNELGVILSIGF